MSVSKQRCAPVFTLLPSSFNNNNFVRFSCVSSRGMTESEDNPSECPTSSSKESRMNQRPAAVTNNNFNNNNINSMEKKMSSKSETNNTANGNIDRNTSKVPKNSASDETNEFKPKIRWPDLGAQLFIHLGCLYGLYLCLVSAKFYTTLFAFLTIYLSGFGITAGAHRLWSHRAYKAKWPLRLLLVFLFTITGQRHVYVWALDHRVHHKFSETDADPHNAKRGFFFSHVGWLFLTPHPDVVEKRATVDMSDLEEDQIVMWQKRLYPLLFFVFVIFLPVGIPIYYWNETLWNSFWVNFNLRFCVTLNMAFFVNSVAHMWGQKPYDKSISPVENLAVSLAALGEGWHNYHHVFPWDYRAGELGQAYNPSTGLIDFFAKIGWAYNLKYASKSMIARRAQKTGDGSHVWDDNGSHVWGYGDKDIEPEDLEELDGMREEALHQD